MAAAIASTRYPVVSATPLHTPGEQDISVLYATLVAVVADCEHGAGVAAQISMICTLYSVYGTIVVKVLCRPASTVAAPEVMLPRPVPMLDVTVMEVTGLDPPSLMLMDN